MKLLLTLLMLTAGAWSSQAEKLPLSIGNIWTYRNAQDGSTFTVQVGAPVWMQSGKVYNYLNGYGDRTLLARIDEQGNLVGLNEENQQEELVTGFGSAVDQWWPASGRACLQEGQVRREPAAYDGPGGRWAKTLEILYRRFSCADVGVESEQFVENVGMVRRVISTIAGPRVFELAYARIGAMVIEPMERGRFTVTLTERSGGQGWDATLRLDIGFVPGIRLEFPSEQEYEVVLRDKERKALWTWSAGKFFAQANRQKSLGNQWNLTVFVPRPENLSGFLEGFTVDAWLTTADGEPKFAASAPIPPPRL